MSRRDEAEVIALDDRAVERRRTKGELVPLRLDETPVRRDVVAAIRRSIAARARRVRERRHRTRTP